MDNKLAKRILHDLELLEDKQNDLHVELKVSITGKDVGKMREPYILAGYFSFYIRQTCKNIDLYGLAINDLKTKAKTIIEANK